MLLFVLFDLLDLCRLHSTTNHAGTVPDRPAMCGSALVCPAGTVPNQPAMCGSALVFRPGTVPNRPVMCGSALVCRPGTVPNQPAMRGSALVSRPGTVPNQPAMRGSALVIRPGTVPNQPTLCVSALVFEFLQAVFYTAESDLQKFFRNIMMNGYISRRPAIIRRHMTVFVKGVKSCTRTGAPRSPIVLPVLVSMACE